VKPRAQEPANPVNPNHEGPFDRSKDWHMPTRSLLDLTQHEIKALRTRYNLADAHTHQRQSISQEKIVSRLPTLWYESEERQQAHFERQFTEAFFRLHGQTSAAGLERTLLSYSASVATMVVAMYLRRNDMNVSLVEPCFDNLVDLLKYLGTPPTPLPEEALADPDRVYTELAARIDTDALYLVDPNNPTGFTLFTDGGRGFAEVLRFCRERRKLLVLDFCFASFALHSGLVQRPDVYRLLEESGVSYLAIEDTGKTWPVQDAKCALLTSSRDIHEEVYNLHTAVLLNVSPFVLNFLTHYVEDSVEDSFASVREVIDTNRGALRTGLSPASPLELLDARVDTSVAWLRIRPAGLTAFDVHDRLLRSEVYVLPGTYFYWANPGRGERFVRIALARPPEQFAEAVRVIDQALGS
jgi:aspartate/methionine/tyrosine aminotransferase